MQYLKFTVGKTLIEFHNNWIGGEEILIVNGQTVSQKSSIFGTNHKFTILEDGVSARYVLTSKWNGLQVLVDLRRNGKVLYEDVPMKFGIGSRKPKNPEKSRGIQKLQSYELAEALAEFTKALDVDADDPEIYFHMACAYSVLEKPLEGFECLRLAVEKGLKNTDAILHHDMLAFLRVNEGFDKFLESNFREYNRDLVGSSS